VHRQRVHVGAQAHRAAAVVTPTADHGHDAGLADAGVILDAEAVELGGNDLRRPVLLEAELGVRVQIASQLGQRGMLAAEVIDGAQD